MGPDKTQTVGFVLCSAHPYRWLYFLFWLGLAAILGWRLAARADLLLIIMTLASLLAGVYSLAAGHCVRVEGSHLIHHRRPLGRLGRRLWPLQAIAEFSWEANRQFDDQIQTRPLKYTVYAHLKDGRLLLLLTFFRESEAAAAATKLQMVLPARDG